MVTISKLHEAYRAKRFDIIYGYLTKMTRQGRKSAFVLLKRWSNQ